MEWGFVYAFGASIAFVLIGAYLVDWDSCVGDKPKTVVSIATLFLLTALWPYTLVWMAFVAVADVITVYRKRWKLERQLRKVERGND